MFKRILIFCAATNVQVGTHLPYLNVLAVRLAQTMVHLSLRATQKLSKHFS